MPEHRTHCPACAGDKTNVVWSLPYSHPYFKELSERFPIIKTESYSFRRCALCELYFQEMILNEEANEKLNGAYWGDEIDPTPMSVRELSHMAEDILIVRQLFSGVTPRVLDYGVGKANWAGMAKGFQCEAWGTDTSNLCEKYCEFRGVKWLPLDAIPKNTFHFINSDAVFEHIPDPLATLGRLKEALVPGGVLKLNLPGKRKFAKLLKAVQRTEAPSDALLDAFFLHIEPLIHINLFRPSNIVSMGENAGLEPYRVPLGLSYSSMVLFNTSRQWNRNLYQPWKRWRSKGTWQFFRKPEEAARG